MLPQRMQTFPQFPEGNAKVIVPYPRNEEGIYEVRGLDIGWSLIRQNSYLIAKGEGYMLTKVCLGSVRCLNPMCQLELVDIRPKINQKEIDTQCKQGCLECGYPLIHNTCNYRVHFRFLHDECHMYPGEKLGEDLHTHDVYEAKHLSDKAYHEFEQLVVSRPEVTPKALLVSSYHGSEIVPMHQINPSLQNLDCTAYLCRKVLKSNKMLASQDSSIEQLFTI
ncbi:hypothetical protein EC973_008072 [Apophysomyces ossiformis]|uniref:Uncharacterized protein n=1 Tax=Apophysomyces ossiformis TaxID=679940 RepID=A0A8H7BIK5_9FUNG|nr:hypothetical protein EC973_008072 [Apophysomyces ossiformis]